MERGELKEAYGKLVVRAWKDEAFKARLLSDPDGVFKEMGIRLPEGIEVKMLENTDKVIHFILPPKPKGEFTEKDFDMPAGGEYPKSILSLIEYLCQCILI